MKMTIGKCIERIPLMTSDERVEYMPQLMNLLSSESLNRLLIFQSSQTGQDYSLYRKAVDEEIVRCLQFEVSEAGQELRRIHDLPVISLDTILSEV